MILYRIPPLSRQETSLYSVMGVDFRTGRLSSELMVYPGSGPRLPDGAFLFSDRIPGGNLKKQLMLLYAQHRDSLWLQSEPLCHLFTLPCPDDAGCRVTEEESLAIQKRFSVYDSPDFLCKYCVITDCGKIRIHLFDTAGTLQKKFALADEIGIANIIFFM